MSDQGDGKRIGPSVGLRLFAGFLILIGIVLLVGGAWLVALGGSPYYLLAGGALVGSGVLLWRRLASGAAVYGALFVLTVAWSVWESGFDAWALLPRIASFLVVGAWFLIPKVARKLNYSLTRAGGGLAISLICAILVGWLLHNVTGQTIVDPIYARGVVAAAAAPGGNPLTAADRDWPSYGNVEGGSRFSELNQLTPANVNKLEIAWEYHTGPGVDGRFGNLEVTPIKIDDRIYFCTPYDDVVALDAESGKQIWRYHSGIDRKGFPFVNCRGVAFYRVPGRSGPCAARIISTRFDGYLIALDAQNGAPCEDFGKVGRVSLLTGMTNAGPGYYFVSSPPIIVRDKVILGGWVADGQYWGEPSGVIRAFDVVTGKFAWAFDMGRPDRTTEPGPGEVYTPSTPNSWGPMSADEELGLVYVPMGNSVPDYFGGKRRPFDDKYNTSTVAIDAETGHVRWSFQIVHHDLWDYDLASQPTLIDLPGPHGLIRALVQATKRGELFVLDRATGRPILPVVERPVPVRGIVPGERVSPTQPFSLGLPSLTGPALTEKMMWGITPIDQLWCRIQFHSRRYDGIFTPPGLQTNIVYPGYAGGTNWGSVTIDQERHLLVVNTQRQANSVRLLPHAEVLSRKLVPMSAKSMGDIGGAVAQANTPYGADVEPFLSPIGVPCQQPPYGMLSAIDLKSGKLVWSHPVGTSRNAGPFGLASHLPIPMGLHMMGGAITTRGRLVFMGASMDSTFRAFDEATGKEVWEAHLPASGNATPITYFSPKSGRQFVVIAAGGHYAPASMHSDTIVAFALPRSRQ